MTALEWIALYYDQNDGVVTILLQESDLGGHFEYAPYIRSADDERYEAVARLFAEPDNVAQRPPMKAGTFALFKGSLSLHHVMPVGVTRQPRIIVLLSYDQRPDQVFGQRYIDHLMQFPSDESRVGAG